jgi:hypothetical protein
LLIKQLITAVLLLSLLGQSFNRALIVTSYYTNTAAYAKNCENKAKPQLRCNGKCQMMKKLEKEEKKDEQNPERKSEQKAEILLSSKSFFPVLEFTVATHPTYQQVFITGREVKMPRTIFHPPSC